MNSVLAFPTEFRPSYNNKMSVVPTPVNSRKRKADDEERMMPSPTIPSQQLQRPMKKLRAGPAGRPISLPRLLETLDTTSLRDVLRSLCELNPPISQEILKVAPRPSVQSALAVLHRYESEMQNAFPFGGDPASDYAYNRVKAPQNALLEALGDFTPHFLPPNEPQLSCSLEFLDEATNIVHRLPNWNSFQNSIVKVNAYDEIAGAWIGVIQEAGKKAAGISLKYDGWDERISQHAELSQGRLQVVVDELNHVLSWTGGPTSGQSRSSDQNSVVQELLSGTYGSNVPVRVGPW